ncbi:MAG: SDR family oxidoreductase [Vicinamibacterales bacterium]
MATLSGKVALVTGASAGIGAALARELARDGADLVLAARREDRLRELAREIDASGRHAVAIGCDVTRDGDLERAVATAVERFGRLDIAVANAGFGVGGPIEELGLDDFRRQLETNVFGVLRTLYAALAELEKTRGQIVMIGSVSGHVPTPGVSAYCMSKFALRGLAESIHDELAARGVSVTLVSPGFVDSDIRRVDNRGTLHDGAPDPVPSWLRMPTDRAARAIVRAVRHRRREVVVTAHGKVLVQLYRHAPWLLHLLISWFGSPKRRAIRQPAA